MAHKQCCGSGYGAFLTPGSGIRKRFFPDTGSRNPDFGSQSHIFESLVTIFWAKRSIILWKSAQIFFFSTSKLKQFSILWNLWLHKKVWQKKFSPLSFVAVYGSEIRDPELVKIRIRDKHPGSATLHTNKRIKNYLLPIYQVIICRWTIKVKFNFIRSEVLKDFFTFHLGR